MHTTRRFVATTVTLSTLALITTRASAQQSYPQSLYWGAGLVDIPVAWVSPISGDFALNYSGKIFQRDTGAKINYNDRINSQLTFSMSFWGRAELGVAAYSANPEEGFFGQGLILNEEDYRARTDASRFLPSVAIGVRNVGPFDKIDRFGVGYHLIPGNPNYQHVADKIHESFRTANTVYGVATKSFSLADIRSSFPDVNLSLTLGYGNGLFSNHGTLPTKLYAAHATGGLFGGLKVDMNPTPQTVLSFMAENNAWDYNIGAVFDYRGVRAGLYLTEIGTSANPDSLPKLYNYSKVAFTLGWATNAYALLKGDFLRGRVAALERQREGLLQQVAQRQARISQLELEINRYEAQNLLELEQRRATAEAQLSTEREALKRLEERLKRLESQQPPPTPPPATKPPVR